MSQFFKMPVSSSASKPSAYTMLQIELRAETVGELDSPVSYDDALPFTLSFRTREQPESVECDSNITFRNQRP